MAIDLNTILFKRTIPELYFRVRCMNEELLLFELLPSCTLDALHRRVQTLNLPWASSLRPLDSHSPASPRPRLPHRSVGEALEYMKLRDADQRGALERVEGYPASQCGDASRVKFTELEGVIPCRFVSLWLMALSA